MPTPDASQFTTLKKYNAIDSRPDNGVKVITHLYQPVPSVRSPRDFLASFTNKFMSPRTVRFSNYPTGPITPTAAPPPTISSFVVQGTYGDPPGFAPGGNFLAVLDASIANATTASYVVYLVSSPTTVVTGTQSGITSGNNLVTGTTPQSITIDPSASLPNFSASIYSQSPAPSGPYIVTLTATGPGGSVSQTINNVNIYYT